MPLDFQGLICQNSYVILCHRLFNDVIYTDWPYGNMYIL